MSEQNKVNRHWRGKYGEVLEQLIGKMTGGFVSELKMEPGVARLAAEMGMQLMQEELGGGGIYFAKGHLFAITQKHRRIFKRWQAGISECQLAKEFDLSERQIYNIIERLQSDEFERKQMKLFGEG